MSEMVPEGWVSCTLGQLLDDISDGGTPATSNRDYYDGNIPWIVIDDIKPQIFDTKNKISELGLKKSSAKLWGAGTIILSTGATIGKVGIAMRSMTTKQGICGLVPNETVSNFFLFHYISSIEHMLNTLSQGSTIKETRPPAIKRIPLNLPPLPEQKKIAAILTSVDDVIESTQKQIDKLQDLKKATMNELLTKGIGHTEFKDSELGRIPKSWEVLKCSDVCVRIMVGIVITPSKYYAEYGVPVLRSANVTKSGIIMSDLKYMTHKSNELNGKSKLETGDVLTVRTGYPGTSAVVPKEVSGSNCVDVIISRPNQEMVNSHFLCSWINSDYGKGEVLRVQGGLAQQHFNVGDLRDLSIKVPPLREQFEIVKIINAVGGRIEKIERKLTHLQSLKKSLMQDLLTGKVRVKVD